MDLQKYYRGTSQVSTRPWFPKLLPKTAPRFSIHVHPTLPIGQIGCIPASQAASQGFGKSMAFLWCHIFFSREKKNQPWKFSFWSTHLGGSFIPVSKWLMTIVSKSPNWVWSPFQMAIHGLKMGVILTTYNTWDDPPSIYRLYWQQRVSNSFLPFAPPSCSKKPAPVDR